MSDTRFRDHMRQRYRALLGYIGPLLMVIGGTILTPLLLIPFYPEEAVLSGGFLIVGGPLFVIGTILWRMLVPQEKASISTYEGMVIVLIVWLAFRLSYRDGRRLESVQITREAIHVARRGPTGQETRYRLPTAWTRVELSRPGEPDVQARLVSHGKSLFIGALLSPKERESLAEAVRAAIAKARGPAMAPQESGGA